MMLIQVEILNLWCVMDKRIAEIVLNRAGNYCEACGLPCSDFALHHRQLKSQGGKDEVCNLIAVHQICPSWATPSAFPLTLSDDSKVLLDNEGNYIYMKEGENGTN
jgi:hypothetical protein